MKAIVLVTPGCVRQLVGVLLGGFLATVAMAGERSPIDTTHSPSVQNVRPAQPPGETIDPGFRMGTVRQGGTACSAEQKAG